MKENNNLIEYLNKKDAMSFKLERIVFEIMFKHIKDRIFVMKAEAGPIFRYIFVNEEAYKCTNIPLNYIGKTMKEVLGKEVYKRLQKEYIKVLHQKKEHVFIEELTRNGSCYYGECVLTPISDENGEVRFIVGITRDITQLIIEQKKLIEREQHYRSIVENNLDAIFAVDLDGSIHDINPAGEKILGCTYGQMKGKKIVHLITGKNAPLFEKLFVICQTTKTSQSLNCLVSQKSSFLPVHIRMIPSVVHQEMRGIYIIMKDMSEKTKSAEKIRFLAFHDQLTGLYNRRALLEELQVEINKAQEAGTQFALLTIDLDRFKYINDNFGHIVGDQILIKVADRLLEFADYRLSVFRQGGDEFNILLIETSKEETSLLAESILSRFTESFCLHAQEYYITPSIGISMFPIDGAGEEALIKNADEALFRVKERGKAHYQFYRSEMNRKEKNVVSLETNLRKAIQRHELTLYYQPQVNLKNKKCDSFEALLRWNSPTLGLISPADFIPLAEETGLIIPIGSWVIETACKQIKNWSKQFRKDIRIAVNISPKQFQQSNFIDMVKSSIEKYSIQPSSLEIEITEGAMQNTLEAIPVLKGLKDLGVVISVDDFGTGYSSLSYIKQFPIDVLKIDQSFVKDVLENDKDAAITTTIIHLGQNLGMEVIAEGVERREQADFLLAANCHKAQGFYFSKPLPSEEINQLFQHQSFRNNIIIEKKGD
ncbi:EAL domain-containing protein [Niallia sp. NCCP-28]|uniref:sensor domain-containing protein n=1 Tax=Niallia sp. NCCP-28 TaxID=2934712 RepID=UPI00208B10A3|nr:EAL domain-containing protein [Niallia sp. NCCP-28]GKU82314.1 GGDEF domain-containing protein [Niallia sp. NCCP-28]